MRKRIGRPSPALVLSLVALFVALGGTGYAAVKINGKNIKKGTIAGNKLKNQAVTSAKLKNGAVTAAKIKNGAVSGAKVNVTTLGKVPAAATADRATTADTAKKADNSLGSHGKLAVGEERVVLTSGPFSILARCADANATPVSLELMFYIATTEAGSWFSSWEDGSLDFGPATPEADREITGTTWNSDTAGGGFDYDNPADASVSAVAPSGAGLNAFPGGTVNFETGCNYAVTATTTG